MTLLFAELSAHYLFIPAHLAPRPFWIILFIV
jgi:hypothetical protein